MLAEPWMSKVCLLILAALEFTTSISWLDPP
jgi:hypothetical protein